MFQTWLAGIGAKLLAVVAVLAVIGGCFWYVKSLNDDAADAKAEAAKLKIEKVAAEAELAAVKREVENAKRFVEILNNELQAARNERQSMVAVFANHDLESLMQAKPGLVTRRMRAATERVWASFEDLSKPVQTNDGVSEAAERRSVKPTADASDGNRGR